ncbi:glucose-1-phosphate cytidylyltransferase [Parablautia intestinalis]|jgi:glucose-1-phosphate cytidylyltransferase|uniref:glucose-1-phosphate cytidylyltransferase n=1 Tax=Parablautia intestinalis TaxID=2320100 RepID=UPI00256F3193|nr:glucose-1-phosphate cytidylyltransferase [Parablautia intestinalis]MCI8614007.1 glucose-1-phosphate cytidylyltransferase [Lachnospiraceae bacterium]
MKVVILAGGRGTRISEESQLKPKPMIDIGGKPILWHIMKTYSYYGFDDFIICCGYKGQIIKEYFINYYVNQSDSTFMLKNRETVVHETFAEAWKVTLANTGLNTLTAGRVLKIKDYIGDDQEFFLTYGDGVSNVNIQKLLAFHHLNKRLATITATQPSGRFGALKINNEINQVIGFKEKARSDSAWVNAGFMVLDRKVFDYLGDGSKMLEAGPFEAIAEEGQMAAYKHEGFWSPMDTMRDKEYLEELWSSGKAPWKVW